MKTIVAFGFLILATAAAAQEHFLDGNALYERLQQKDVSAMTYILGVYDAVQIVQYHAPAAERYFCAPPGLTGKEVTDAVLAHLERDEIMRDLPAGVMVLSALIAKFPCDELKAGIPPAAQTRQTTRR